MIAFTVHASGPLATIQDLGRPGYAGVGVSVSGAADRAALIRANGLVGNLAGAPAIESTLGGLILGVESPLTVAVAGAPAPVSVNDTLVDVSGPIRLTAGDVVSVGMPVTGLRVYVAIRGGIAVEPVLGSASWDSLARIGPPPLGRGAVIRRGYTIAPREGSAGIPRPDSLPDSLPVSRSDSRSPIPGPPGTHRVRAWFGPREDWFEPQSLLTLATRDFVVTTASDRIGLRLAGPVLKRRRFAELPSEPVVRGSVQVPPDGQPLVFLADHPTTGGYPVIAVVEDAETDHLAQARPGEVIRFAMRQPTWS